MGTEAIASRRAPKERVFFGAMAVALFAAVFLGFARSYFLRAWFPEFRVHTPSEPFFYLHGTVFVLWFVLLMVQPTLVAARRVDLHRRAGWFGAGLAVAMIVLGTHGALVAARRPTGFVDLPVPPRQFLLTPLVDLLLFALFIGLAIGHRRDPQAHKRWMLLGSISIVIAAVARWPFGFLATGGPLAAFGVTDLFLLPILFWDFATRRRPHPVTVVGGLVLIASQPLRFALSGTAAWDRIAAWLIG